MGVNQKDKDEGRVRLTTGRSSAIVAIKSQMTPLQKKKRIYESGNHGKRESSPYLLPHDLGQTKCAATVLAQAKQAGEHDDK